MKKFSGKFRWRWSAPCWSPRGYPIDRRRGAVLVVLAVALLIRPGLAAEPEAVATASAPADVWSWSEDPTVWPNQACKRTSEPWLMEHHDQLRQIRPRVLVLNFANDVDMPAIKAQTEAFIEAVAQSSRYHAYKSPEAPPFVKYQVVRYVDLRSSEPEMAKRTSTLFPVRSDHPKNFWCDYHALYNDAFARRFGFEDPARPGKYLNLHQLIDAGIVHELWFYAIHEYKIGWPAFEVVELKQYYDEKGMPIAGRYGPAGNGGDAKTLPWSGRSFRVFFFNPHRGPGCQLENFGHLLEAYSRFDAIKPFTPYFREFAGLDWDTRYGLPFNSFYRMPYSREKQHVFYPDEDHIRVEFGGNSFTFAPFDVFCGNVHWAPGARYHYDLDSPVTVRTVLENYRLRNGKNGGDKLTPFNIKQTEKYSDVAGDCQGRWLVYWLESMPGLNNTCVDDQGRPMKNWWPYLVY